MARERSLPVLLLTYVRTDSFSHCTRIVLDPPTGSRTVRLQAPPEQDEHPPVALEPPQDEHPLEASSKREKKNGAKDIEC